MIIRNYFSIVFTITALSLSRSSAYKSLLTCMSPNRKNICDDLRSLRTEIDINTDDRLKWNRHYHFVQNFHDRWEEEISKVLEQQMKNLNSETPKLQPRKNKLDEMLLKAEKQNLELQSKISDMDAILLATVNRAQKLEFDLRNEREVRKAFEKQSLKRQALIETQNAELWNEVTRIPVKLKTVESAVVKIQDEVKSEKEERKKIENDVREILPSFLVFNPENYTRNIKELQATFKGFGRKLDALENQGLLQGYEIYKEQNSRKKLESSFGKLKSAALKSAEALRPVIPSSVLDNLTKEFNISEDGEAANLKSDFSDITSSALKSNPYIEMSSKLEDLEADMKILTDALEKATSNIKALENKYTASKKSQGSRRLYEYVRPHEKSGGKRPFDPHRDP